MSTMAMDIDYDNKLFLAPMVRVGTLPFRLLALQYGADLVWSEELIDKRIIGCERSFNAATGTIEYRKNNVLCFSTHPDEKGKVILQLGTADPDLALKAALTMREDVAGIDVNCGCPKKFSIQGGMGAALLSEPEKLKSILTNLVKHCGLPVTCKIRILESEEKTVELVKMIESTGVKAITVHCRTRDQRPNEKANWEALKAVVDAVKTIPVAINGDLYSYDDISKARELTKASSFMFARGAIYNASVFRPEGFLPHDIVVREYIKKCVDVGSIYQNVKYVLLSMPGCGKASFPGTDQLQKAKSVLAICEVFGLESYYHEAIAAQKKRKEGAEEKELEKDKEAQAKETENTKEKPLEGDNNIPAKRCLADLEVKPAKKIKAHQ